MGTSATQGNPVYNLKKDNEELKSLIKEEPELEKIDKIDDDRPMNDDINNCTFFLEEFVTNGKIEKLFKI